ncbi:hypothetical protein N825_09290 [Skermanella stibiiresistens SB22]|uniref:FLZ-type domain-containing protein n=1 Tax=Skermanella stibiiresistens SB22 TaxID=1385369 RepID=W9GVE4_9PROT|nr:hypothetical protein [Skermanella stibiiresistens]EWY37764.1 hypothetical protein N825_09290 [Skermanella stibiiresistens SB22]
MKFAPNKLYVESYIKCHNCGVLIYEAKRPEAVMKGEEIYCSQWCVDWEEDRTKRHAAAAE